MKVGVVLISIKLKTLCQYLLNPKMEITTTHQILLFKIMLYAIFLFFLAQCMRLHCSFILFFASNICSDSCRTSSVWNVKIVFSGDCTSGFHFICSIINCLCGCIYFLLMFLLSWSITLDYNCHCYWTCVQEEPYLPHSNLQFPPIIFYHAPPIFL